VGQSLYFRGIFYVSINSIERDPLRTRSRFHFLAALRGPETDQAPVGSSGLHFRTSNMSL
jgi:hypothetical protein